MFQANSYIMLYCYKYQKCYGYMDYAHNTDIDSVAVKVCNSIERQTDLMSDDKFRIHT
jgi:hypothetical protein